MAKRTRGTAAARRAPNRGFDVRQFARGRPLAVGILGVAVGIALGTLIRLRPEETEFLDEQAGRLRERAAELKNSVSEIAVEGYAKAKQATQDTIEVAEGLIDSGSKQTSGSANQNILAVHGDRPSRTPASKS